MKLDRTDQSVTLESDLIDFQNVISRDRKTGKIRKDCVTQRVVGMLSHLSRKDDIFLYVPRRIGKVKELYSFNEEEIEKGFSQYREKTWIRLNEILRHYNLPSVKLPLKYRSHH